MLIEVVICMILLTMVALGLVSGVVIARQLTYSNAQRVAAFGLARARLEELKGLRYETIDPLSYSTETNIQFAHLGGTQQKALEATRVTRLTALENPTRIHAAVAVRWYARGRLQQESATTFIYPR